MREDPPPPLIASGRRWLRTGGVAEKKYMEERFAEGSGKVVVIRPVARVGGKADVAAAATPAPGRLPEGGWLGFKES